MLEERTVYINGDFVRWSDATVHMMSHSFGRGTAIFEVMSVHDAESGPSVFRLDEHISRLFRTAGLLKMNLAVERDALHEACLESVRQNQVQKGFIKVLCYYSAVAFDIFPPDAPLDVAIFVVDPAEDLGGIHFPFEKGAAACFSRWRKLDPQTVPIEAKASANYLNGIMARVEARERGYDNVIMLDTQGFVAEGSTESVFMVEGGRLFTPCAGTVLLSITRLSLLQIARALDLEVSECRIPPERLMGAAEILLAGTPNKVLPVRKLEDRDISGTPGPITQRLSALMMEITSGRSEQFKQWLFPVS